MYLCPDCAAGGMGVSPILDKLESFVVNALQYIVSGVSNKKLRDSHLGVFYFTCIEMLACISTLF